MLPDPGEANNELKFLHEFYKTELKRENGLWRQDLNQPDFEGISAWYLGIYQSKRIAGYSPYEARQAYIELIRNSEEWRDKNQSSLPQPTSPQIFLITYSNQGPFHPRFYSYWSSSFIKNNQYVITFAGHMDGNPRFFELDLYTGNVRQLHNYIDIHINHVGTTEGWSWDSHGWIYLIGGPKLYRVNPFNGDEHVIIDISQSHPECRLWQSHSSDDGTTHCATIQKITADGPYEKIGTIALRNNHETFYPAIGKLDESQITGQYLIIKEERKQNGILKLDNRIINLDTGEDHWILDENGALGHSDGENGILIGEDNYIGACVFWDLNHGILLRPRILFHTWNMGYVSVRNGRVLVSDKEHISLLDLNGNLIIPLHAHGVTATDYDSRVKANLDPTGKFATYMAHGQIYVMRLN